jgi:glycine reductase
VRSEKLASERAIEMLLRKMKGEPFRSEITVPGLDRVAPAPPVGRISEAVIALVTEGGLVPRGNPDGLETARATRYAGYPLEELENLGAGGFQSIHRGFDTTFVNEDPDRLVPVDVMREFEREGVFKGLHPTFFVTTGVATTLDYAKKIGRGIAGELRSAGVSAAIVTST